MKHPTELGYRNHLRAVALVESTGASTRIEGGRLTDREVACVLIRDEVINRCKCGEYGCPGFTTRT